MIFIYRESAGKEREKQWGGRETGWQNELNLEEAGNKQNVKLALFHCTSNKIITMT